MDAKMQNPSAILLNAEEFRRAGIKLEGDFKTPNFLSDEHVLIPMLVCYAFALELYLKFLIRVQNSVNPENTHDIKKPFEMLPKQTAAAIRLNWENPHPSQVQQREALAKIRNRPYHTFENMLDQVSEGFQRLRYSYAYNKNALEWDGGELMACARRFIFALYPNEYADVRLPLPQGASHPDQINIIKSVRMEHRLRVPKGYKIKK